MGTGSKIKAINAALKKFDLNNEVKKTLKDRKIKIQLTQLLKDQMRFTEGADIGEYAPFTQEVKDRSNYWGKWAKPDLFDTGKFQKSIFLESDSNSWGFWARDGKTSDLVKHYTEIIFELNSNNMNNAQIIVQTDLSRKVKVIFK